MFIMDQASLKVRRIQRIWNALLLFAIAVWMITLGLSIWGPSGSRKDVRGIHDLLTGAALLFPLWRQIVTSARIKPRPDG